jgi:hypothetical protein
MTWEAIGAIGEAAGAAGVIATLIYVAVQIRQNTRSVEAATYQSVAESLADSSYHLADAYSSPFSGLLLFIGTIRRYENLHFQVRRGNLLRSDVEGFVTSLGAYLHVPTEDGRDPRELWAGSRPFFHPAFVAFVENEVLSRGDEFEEARALLAGSPPTVP